MPNTRTRATKPSTCGDVNKKAKLSSDGQKELSEMDGNSEKLDADEDKLDEDLTRRKSGSRKQKNIVKKRQSKGKKNVDVGEEKLDREQTGRGRRRRQNIVPDGEPAVKVKRCGGNTRKKRSCINEGCLEKGILRRSVRSADAERIELDSQGNNNGDQINRKIKRKAGDVEIETIESDDCLVDKPRKKISRKTVVSKYFPTSGSREIESDTGAITPESKLKNMLKKGQVSGAVSLVNRLDKRTSNKTTVSKYFSSDSDHGEIETETDTKTLEVVDLKPNKNSRRGRVRNKKSKLEYNCDSEDSEGNASEKLNVGKTDNVKKKPRTRKKRGKNPDSEYEIKPRTRKAAVVKKKKIEKSAGSKKKKPAKEIQTDGVDIKSEPEIKQAAMDGTTLDSGDSDMSDWEEVEDLPSEMDSYKDVLNAVEVTVKIPSLNKQKKDRRSKQEQMADWGRQLFNRHRTQLQIEVHKVHLLCLLATGFRENSACNDETLLATALSLIPAELLKKSPSAWTLSHLMKIMSWIKDAFVIDKSLQACNQTDATTLLSRLQTGKVANDKELVQVFVTTLRALGLTARLVAALNPVSMKPSDLKAKLKLDPGNSTCNKPTKEEMSVLVAASVSPEKTKSKVSSDDDFEEEKEYRSPVAKNKKKKSGVVSQGTKRGRRLKTTERVYESVFWAEVYLELKGKWVCVDCVRGSTDCEDDMESYLPNRICYVLTFDNEGFVKDVTKRYSRSWTAHIMKVRVDPDWWTATLRPYLTTHWEENEKEDTLLKLKLMDRPLPTSIAELKDHPLYVIQRHLLKYQALYPPNLPSLGFIKGEPIYARECVHTLHTRDVWYREVRAVKVGEEPYKRVKGLKTRTKRNYLDGSKPPEAELFGYWQTEHYVPPPAVDGVVPRNAYGNVDLFKPELLPAGTVHIQLPGLNRIARKLDIDCPSAMVGWDFHSGFNHPVMDGFVVCKEHKDILIAAWDEEQAIMEEKEAQKREERAVKNWKIFFKGVLLQDKLKKKYVIHDMLVKEEKKKKQKKTREFVDCEKATNLKMSWPQNRMEEKAPPPKKQQGPLFPFEMEVL